MSDGSTEVQGSAALPSHGGGSSKRKSKPVKRIIEPEVHARIDDEEECSSSLKDTVNYATQLSDCAGDHQDESSASPGVSGEITMDHTEALRRFNEMLTNVAGQSTIQTNALQSLLAAAASCSVESASLPSPVLSASEPSPSQSFLQTMFGASPFFNGVSSCVSQPPMTPLMNNLNLMQLHGLKGIDSMDHLTSSPSQLGSSSSSRPTPKRKLFETLPSKDTASAISKEERIDLDDLENFAQMFKKQRIKFGFTQGDVGVALGRRYGTDFSQTTISRFEALNLSFKNMCKLRPLLREWLVDAEAAIANGASLHDLIDRPQKQQMQLAIATSTVPTMVPIPQMPSSPDEMASSLDGQPNVKRRRKRTNLDLSQRTFLDACFNVNPRPDHDKMTEIANMLDLDRDVVRVWFCNRRQKLRRTDEPETTENPLLASLKALQAQSTIVTSTANEMESAPDNPEEVAADAKVVL